MSLQRSPGCARHYKTNLEPWTQFAQGMNEQTLREKVQSVHKESFKFGTDDYMWFTKVDLNR